MLARHYIAKREKEVKADLLQWHKEQVAKWEERKRQAEADGKDFTEPAPDTPAGDQQQWPTSLAFRSNQRAGGGNLPPAPTFSLHLQSRRL